MEEVQHIFVLDGLHCAACAARVETAVTKLDGSAKGGVVIGIVDQFQIPIKFLGIGEGIDDLKVFDKKEFVKNLFTIDDLKK